MEELVKILIEKKKTISTMESCTGGGIINAITNIPDASKVIKFSAVTYSNDFKIKMGVKKEVINTYSVYSMETAVAMAKKIADYTKSSYGVGVTGKLNKPDLNNPVGDDNSVFLAIYDSDNSTNYCIHLYVKKDTREENKQEIIDAFVKNMKNIIKESN